MMEAGLQAATMWLAWAEDSSKWNIVNRQRQIIVCTGLKSIFSIENLCRKTHSRIGFQFNCQAEAHPGQFDFDLSKGACQLPAFLEGDSFYL